MPRISVKGQVLTDLVAEFAESSYEREVETLHMDGKSVGIITLQEPLVWKVYVDSELKGVRSGANSGLT